MPPVLARDFHHETGFHCGSSALRKLLAHYGHDLSEPTCMGLGMGPGFYYFPSEHTSPTRFFGGRNPMMEEDFFRVLGIDAPVHRHKDPFAAWPPVKAVLDAGHPVLVQVDIFHLPYYKSSTHFGGHKVLAVGYDPDAETVLISDSEFAHVQTVTLAQFAQARWDPTPPYDLEGHWWEIRDISRVAPMKQAVPASIREAASRMVRNESGMFGLPAMRRMEADLPAWGEALDWRWSARFGYQIIERRGTGGGSFRTQYANFLEQCVHHDPLVKKLRLATRMREIGVCWTNFAMHLKGISERDEPSGFDDAQILFEEIVNLEEEFFEDIARAYGD